MKGLVGNIAGFQGPLDRAGRKEYTFGTICDIMVHGCLLWIDFTSYHRHDTKVSYPTSTSSCSLIDNFYIQFIECLWSDGHYHIVAGVSATLKSTPTFPLGAAGQSLCSLALLWRLDLSRWTLLGPCLEPGCWCRHLPTTASLSS